MHINNSIYELFATKEHKENRAVLLSSLRSFVAKSPPALFPCIQSNWAHLLPIVWFPLPKELS